MKCPKCNSKAIVINSRGKINDTEQIRYRRYKCEKCDTRFTTYERLFAVALDNYDVCYEDQEYDGQDCKKCPYLKKCGGYQT